jgi:hypothetical protein
VRESIATAAYKDPGCFSGSYLGGVINGLSIRCQQYTRPLLTWMVWVGVDEPASG